MRIVFLGHACHLIESRGCRVITDPWLCDPAFGGLVEHDPPLGFGIGDLPPIDAIVLTHGHLDHFNAPSLAAFADKSIPVVHPAVTVTELDVNLRLLGFTNLHERADWEPFQLEGLTVVPTPSLGTIDECAYLFLAGGESFWNGADAPQPASVTEEIAHRFGPVDLGAFSHNSFDQPSLLGLESVKDADHGPVAACESARVLGVKAALPASSSMRWCGRRGEEITAKVIRRSADDLRARLAAELPDVEVLDLAPGDAWSRDAGVERKVVSGSPAAPADADYIHVFTGSGSRWCPSGRPSSDDTFRRDLPGLTASRRQACLGVGRRVFVSVVGDDDAAYTVDFGAPGAVPETGDVGAEYGVEVRDDDWKDLFERRLSWQILLMSDRLRVLRFKPGPAPQGLHFVYAMQGVFP